MPFTGSHPAAVLPLLRLGLVPSALVIGSMAPDLPYFLGLGTESSLTHSALGIVTVDLFMGGLAFVLWQWLVAPAAVALGPRGMRARLAPQLPVPWQDHARSAEAVAVVLASLVVGAITHVLWDAFTHEGRWGTNLVPWLSDELGPLPGYRWAQYASGVVGLVCISIGAWRWWHRTPPADPAAEPQRIRAVSGRVAAATWIAVVGFTAAATVAGVLVGLADGDAVRRALFQGAVWGGAAALATTLGSAVLLARVVSASSAPAARWRPRHR